MSNEQNDQLILICGESGTGKSASLRNIRNQEKWIYCNTEAGKRLPFKNKFINIRVDDPLTVLQVMDQATDRKDEIEGIIVDSLTFLMEQFESKYVLTAINGMKA